jgi:hypothetical protein
MADRPVGRRAFEVRRALDVLVVGERRERIGLGDEASDAVGVHEPGKHAHASLFELAPMRRDDVGVVERLAVGVDQRGRIDGRDHDGRLRRSLVL